MSQLDRIIAHIDEVNAEDPNLEWVDGEEKPKALLYGLRMSAWLARLRPDAPEALRIAARAQHIARWKRPRADYPMDRKGYLRWRRDLQDYHADTAGEIMARAGYGEADIERVGFLLRKRQLHRDPDTPALEDCACLVFLAHEFPAFAQRTDPDKVVQILRKTWQKMSKQGREEALKLDLPEDARRLLKKAIAQGGA